MATEKNVNSCEILLLEPRLPKARLKILRDIGHKKGWRIVDKWSPTVTHIVTAYDNAQKIVDYLKIDRDKIKSILLATVDWLTTCYTENTIGPVCGKFAITPPPTESERENPADNLITFVDTKYECEKKTPLNHQNMKLTKALEILEEAASFHEDQPRALAFRRASCALKSLPWKVTKPDQVIKLNHIGNHAAKVVKEVIEDGNSPEVEEILSDPWFKVMKIFMLVYGCGVVTAKKWHSLGLSSLSDLKDAEKNGKVSLTKRQRLGVQYYNDLATPVSTKEALQIKGIIEVEAKALHVDADFHLVGGQRRGKESGHDVDLMIKIGNDIDAGSYLQQLIDILQEKNLLINVDYNSGSNATDSANRRHHHQTKQKMNRPVTMDTLHKAFTIFKFPKQNVADNLSNEPPCKRLNSESTEVCFVARRVDIIIARESQFPVALLGWTGSKQFNRSLRLLASKEHNIEISNTSIWDCSKQPPEQIIVKSEEEIFSALGIPCFDPTDRNC